MQGHEGPEATELAPAHEVTLGFWAPEQQQAVAHGISGGADGGGEEVAALQVGAGNAVGVPRSNKSGAGEPAAKGEIGGGEQEQARPTDKDKAVALEPVIEDVEPSPLWRAP